ncbi:MAG: erythromycin biosynthesis sensory transduction protein eryC1 [candidate division Zixibacteria bacterium SM23_73_3]|nr:MAG: erythromycin biosynthesis sensory transduction protein eryC1 [candidate division Zixibacteria bacterium SM23_73_3]
MKVNFVDLKAQYQTIKPEIDSAIQNVISNTAFVLGKAVAEFEQEFASYCDVNHGMGINSGTSALIMALKALEVAEGDEVITTPNTFIATAEAISYAGAKPVFVDIEEKSYNMDPTKLEKAITGKTKAIIPVHLYGQPADMDPILQIAEKKEIPVIEDSAQAHGALYKEKKTGGLAMVGCFSFYPGKNLGAYGEGGAVTTNHDDIAQKVRMLRDHGSSKKFYHEYIGNNCRLEGIQGAVLSVKLKHLDKWNDGRRENANLYRKYLKGSSVKVPEEMPYSKHVYHVFCVRVKEREKLIDFLKEKDIYTNIHYPIPIHLQNAYSFLGYKKGSFPVTEGCMDEILSLPMFAELTEEQIKYTTDCIREFYGE